MSGNVYSSGLVFPNGALINGIAQINQSTLPVTRPDGSALVVRDKWYNTASGEEGFWNGTYWLAQPLWLGHGSYVSANGAANSTYAAVFSYFLANFYYQYINTGVIDDSNYWLFTIKGLRSDGAVGVGYTALTNKIINTQQATVSSLIEIPANILAPSDSSGNTKGYQIQFTKVGTPGPLFINTSALYYKIM